MQGWEAERVDIERGRGKQVDSGGRTGAHLLARIEPDVPPMLHIVVGANTDANLAILARVNARVVVPKPVASSGGGSIQVQSGIPDRSGSSRATHSTQIRRPSPRKSLRRSRAT